MKFRKFDQPVTSTSVGINVIVGVAIAAALLSSCAREELKRPNILFAIADDASFPHTGANGCTWVSTPAFDFVAQNGINFVNAYTPNAKCSPSRACILTGRNSWQLEEATNHVPHFPDKFGSFMEALKAAGYHTGHTAKGWAPGKVGTRHGVRRELTGKAYNDAKISAPTSGISTNDYATNFSLFLEDRSADEPFCFWYGAIEPHRRYEFMSGVNKGEKSLSDVDQIMAFYPDNDTIRHDLLDYGFEIEHFDYHLGLMLDQLHEIGELENTIVIVTADNGMPFPRIKGQTYELSNHLPLAIMWLDRVVDPGREVVDLVSFIDFAPTILEAAAVEPDQGAMATITGQSLMPFIDHRESSVDWRVHLLMGKERHDIGRPNDQGYPTRAILQGDLLYIKNFEPDRWPVGNPETGYLNTDGSPTKTWILSDRRMNSVSQYWDWSFGKRPSIELYDITQDPYCINNLVDQDQYRAYILDADRKMMDELRTEGDPRALGNGKLFDEYPYAQKKHANFYQRYMDGELRKEDAGWVNPGDFEEQQYEGSHF